MIWHLGTKHLTCWNRSLFFLVFFHITITVSYWFFKDVFKWFCHVTCAAGHHFSKSDLCLDPQGSCRNTGPNLVGLQSSLGVCISQELPGEASDGYTLWVMTLKGTECCKSETSPCAQSHQEFHRCKCWLTQGRADNSHDMRALPSASRCSKMVTPLGKVSYEIESSVP